MAADRFNASEVWVEFAGLIPKMEQTGLYANVDLARMITKAGR